MEFRISSSVDDLLVFDSLNQNAQGVMKRTVGFIQNVLTRPSQDNGAGLISFASGKLDNFVFSNQDLLDAFASSQDFLRSFRVIKG